MYRSICTVALFALFGSTLGGPGVPGNWNTLDDECFKESGVVRADYEKYLADPKIENFFDNNKSCYYLCTGKKSGEVNADGTFKIAGIISPTMKKIISPSLRKMLNKCAKKIGQNPCDTLQKNIQCMLDSVTAELPTA